MIMAHGVGAEEYDVFDDSRDAPARVNPAENEWLPHPDKTGYYGGDEYNIAAHKRYRADILKRYGSLPPLEELVAVGNP